MGTADAAVLCFEEEAGRAATADRLAQLIRDSTTRKL